MCTICYDVYGGREGGREGRGGGTRRVSLLYQESLVNERVFGNGHIPEQVAHPADEIRDEEGDQGRCDVVICPQVHDAKGQQVKDHEVEPVGEKAEGGAGATWHGDARVSGERLQGQAQNKYSIETQIPWYMVHFQASFKPTFNTNGTAK